MTEPGEGRREAVAKEVHRALSQHNAKGHNAAARIAFSTADRILAALEGAEPVAWTWRYELQSEWFYRRGPTKPTLAKEPADIFPLYRHPPEHGTGRGTQEAYGIIGEALTLAYEAQKADGEARSGDCGQALEELSRLFRENPELVEALHRTDRQEPYGRSMTEQEKAAMRRMEDRLYSTDRQEGEDE